MFKVTINNKTYEYESKVTLDELAQIHNPNALCATVNNRLRELTYYVNYDCTVELLDINDAEGVRVYESTIRYLVIMALENLYPGISIRFNQSVSRSLSCSILTPNIKVSRLFLEKLTQELNRIVSLDLPITRKKLTKEEAKELYIKKGYLDKAEVLEYREEEYVNQHLCGEYSNYMFGYLASHTGVIKDYKLKIYYPDFIIQYPRSENNGKIPEFEESPIFGQMIKESDNWSKMIKCDRLPLLNKYATERAVVDLVNICETRHNNMLAEVGEIIKMRSDSIRLICIAGPSSSGKTTFSHRLRIELLSRGIKTIKISMDDYYKDRENCPIDENGDYDFEHVNAIDIDLFTEHILGLIDGEEIEKTHFDFKLGKRVVDEKIKIDEKTVIIVEGIHALNEEVTKLIPKHQKFKIYICPMPQINIDNHNPIRATDVRLIRRIVRDYKFRKTDPSKTLAMWPSVRRGEFKWIYPFQEAADFVFNTELTYELAVLKKYALASLSQIKPDDEYYIQANRLVKFLKYVRDIDDKYVPCNSILKEFIGGSVFYDEDGKDYYEGV